MSFFSALFQLIPLGLRDEVEVTSMLFFPIQVYSNYMQHASHLFTKKVA